MSFVTDGAGIATTWTAEAATLFGFSADEMLGWDVAILVPSDRRAQEQSVRTRVLAGEHVAAFETERFRRDGTRIAVVLNAAPVFYDDLVSGVRWSAREVRLARALESARFRSAAVEEHASDPMLTVDETLRVRHINFAAERHFGRPRAESLGRPAAEVLSEEPSRWLNGVLGTGAAATRDGMTAVPFKARDGAVIGGVVVVHGAPEHECASCLAQRLTAIPGALDLDESLERAAGAFVAEFAEVCLIYSFEGATRLRLRTSAATDPAVRRLARKLHDSTCPLDTMVERALIDGDLPAMPDRLSAETPRGHSGSSDEIEFAALLGPLRRTSFPLRGRDGIFGIAMLFSADGGRELASSDPRGAQKLADRAGKALEDALRHADAAGSRARFAAAFESAPIGMALVRADEEGLGIITEANPALGEIAALSHESLVGSQLIELYHPDDREVARESAQWLISGELDRYAGERRFQRADGHLVWVQVAAARLDGNAIPHVVLQIQDVTERKRNEIKLQFLADHDSQTGLYNRRRFIEELEWVMAYSRRYGSPAAVLVVDLDNFKFVNDTFGHGTGDQMLALLGETLRSRCRDTDITGRLGGDEFGVILSQSGRDEAGLVAQSVLDAVRHKVQVRVGDRTVRATASVGVRLIGANTTSTAEEILSDADIALYDAKEGGRDRLSMAGDDGAVTDRLRVRMGWSDRIRDALLHDKFELFEQPIVAVGSGRVQSTELLLRMRDRDGSMIAPAHFLDVAEHFGQIQAIDCWVIARAIRLLAQRQAAGIDLDLEVNLSGGSITDETVIDFIVSEVRDAPINPTRLTFEVTETAAIVNIERARTLAQSLADLGCRFALDDFGSGFGSFYYLKHLPFDIVKIDGEFIKELTSSHADRLTVEAIVQIARGLGKPTIAERVEDEPTLELLGRLGVDFAQGYHLGRPRPVVADPGFGGAT